MWDGRFQVGFLVRGAYGPSLCEFFWVLVCYRDDMSGVHHNEESGAHTQAWLYRGGRDLEGFGPLFCVRFPCYGVPVFPYV